MAPDASADPRYRVLVDMLDEGFVFQDEAGRVVFANPAASRILGLSLDQLRGGTSYDPAWNASFADGEIDPARHPAVVARETGKAVTNVVMRVAHGDGREVWISVNARPVFDDGSRRPSGVVVSFSEVSDQITAAAARREAVWERQQREADAERHRLETDLASAQRLESLGRLAGGIAHDFNNLLGVILNYAGFVAKQLEPGSMVADDVVEIRRAAERAAELTRQLLLFGRRESTRAETFEAAPVVEGVVALCRHSLGDVDLRLDLPTGSPSIRADRGQLEQVLMNLLLNARDANATEIVVTVGAGSTGAGSEQVALTVADDGDGMTPETLDHAFEPFFTTKSRDRGSGLGLASVHGIVTRAGGTVSIESTLGSGTRVSLGLPAGGARVEEVAHESRGARPGSAPTVLVVDDEPEVRVMTARILRDHGLRVIEAHSAREALRVAKQRSAEVALLLTDVVMPSLSGVELVGIFRVLHPHVEVLLMSGYTDGAVDDALEIPLLMKPFNEIELVGAVTHALVGDRSGQLTDRR